VTVTNSKALPAGTNLELVGYGTLSLRDFSPNPAYEFGDITIRDGASLITSVSGNGEVFSARSILLEGGRLVAPLVGNIPIAKRTEGVAIINFPSPGFTPFPNPGFTGQVDVFEGTLQAGDGASDGYQSFGAGTVNVLPAGRLALSAVFPAPNSPAPSLKLNGGSLFGVGNASDGRVNWRGAVEVVEDSAIYLMDGSLDRPRNVSMRVEGAIHVASGKSLSIIGRPDSSQGLLASEGIQLDHGAVLAGDGAITAHVRIADGAVLSPGLVEQDMTVGLLAMAAPNLVADLPNSRMTWAGGGRYRWEINDVGGDAGAPFGRGWDVVQIGVLLDITATPAAPFIIEPVALGEVGEAGAVNRLVPHQHYRWLIAEIGRINAFSATITGFAADKFAIDLSKLREVYPHLRSSDFWLDIDSNGIHLNATVIPEPATVTLIFIALAAIFSARLRCVVRL
jgi:hypothetical protein